MICVQTARDQQKAAALAAALEPLRPHLETLLHAGQVVIDLSDPDEPDLTDDLATAVETVAAALGLGA